MQASRDCFNLQEIQGEASVIYLDVYEYFRSLILIATLYSVVDTSSNMF